MEPPSHQQKGKGRKTKQTQLDNNNDQQQAGESRQFVYDSNLECKLLSLVNPFLANNLCFMVKFIDKAIVIYGKIHKNKRKTFYSSHKKV